MINSAIPLQTMLLRSREASEPLAGSSSLIDNIACGRHMVTKICVNIGSGNGLLPVGNNPLPEPMLTYYQEGQVAFIWGQFY